MHFFLCARQTTNQTIFLASGTRQTVTARKLELPTPLALPFHRDLRGYWRALWKAQITPLCAMSALRFHLVAKASILHASITLL